MPIVNTLFTPRLRLEPVTETVIEASERGRAVLEAQIGASIHDEWRGVHVFDRGRLAVLDRKPRHALVVWREGEVVIGEARFEPQRAGPGVEIGYGVVPSYRRRGVATEAMQAVIEALESQGAAYLVAGCAMKNRPSVGTLRKLGFTLDGSSARGSAFWWVKHK